ncbi:hypothetical protein EDC96DRAFT_536481 [Choanephora cucurbitarum]|nr:hypothetical protein EDC96DRAFT_536481 [Choanephora cucurbitarum]
MQGAKESNRQYATRYQRLCPMMFFSSLRDDVRKGCLSSMPAFCGAQLPSSIQQVIDLILACDDETYNPTKRRVSEEAEPHKKMKSNDNQRTGKSSQEPCHFCNRKWYDGHKCKQFYEHLKQKNKGQTSKQFDKVSRMAIRTSSSPSAGHEQGEDINGMNQIVTKDFKNVTKSILFPITVERNFRTLALLDCGADFSAVSLSFCKRHNFTIKSLSSYRNNFIKMADNNTTVKRLGTCVLSTTCNQKTITHEFEVMNLNIMHVFGIGIYGLPVNYDDPMYLNETDAKRRFESKSELLEQIDRENQLSENSPVCTKTEFELAMKEIEPYVQKNQAILKGSFCTIPESVVYLHTPPECNCLFDVQYDSTLYVSQSN